MTACANFPFIYDIYSTIQRETTYMYMFRDFSLIGKIIDTDSKYTGNPNLSRQPLTLEKCKTLA